MDNIDTLVNDIKAKVETRADKSEVDQRFNELKAEYETRSKALEQKMSSFQAPASASPVETRMKEYRDFADALVKGEKRSITANGAGSVNVVPDIVRAMVDYGKLTRLCSVFYGPDAKTTVPVFAPHLALPVGQTEGGTGIGSDGTGVLAGKDIAVKPFYSILPVSRLAVQSTTIDSQINTIFGEAFAAGFDNQICNGAASTASPFTGLFDVSMTGTIPAANLVTAASATAITWKELATLAKKIKAVAMDMSRVAIVIHPDVISTLLTALGASPALELEYLTKGTVAGVPVVESTYAQKTMTTGKYVAVAANFAHYGIAMASQINVDQIKTLGSDNVNMQAFSYANGIPLIHSASISSFMYLKLA